MSEEEVKEEIKTEKTPTGDDFDGAFEETAESAAQEEEGAITEEAEAEEEKKEEEKPSEEIVEKKEEIAEVVDWEAKAKEYQQQAEENQAWGSRLAQENAELKKPKEEKPPAKEEEAEIPETVQEFYDENPEARAAVQFEAERLFKERFGEANFKDINARVVALQDRTEQAEFENIVSFGYTDYNTGKYVEGHTDLGEIIRSKEYKTWLSNKRERDPDYGYVGLDAVKSIEILTEYKNDRAKAAAKRHDDKLKTDADAMKESVEGSVSSQTDTRSEKQEKVDKEDFDGAFEEEDLSVI